MMRDRDVCVVTHPCKGIAICQKHKKPPHANNNRRAETLPAEAALCVKQHA